MSQQWWYFIPLTRRDVTAQILQHSLFHPRHWCTNPTWLHPKMIRMLTYDEGLNVSIYWWEMWISCGFFPPKWTSEQATSQVKQPLSTSMYRPLLNTFLSVGRNGQSAVCILHRKLSETIQANCHVSSVSMKLTKNLSRVPPFILTLTQLQVKQASNLVYLSHTHTDNHMHRMEWKVVSFTWRTTAFRWCLSSSPNLD